MHELVSDSYLELVEHQLARVQLSVHAHFSLVEVF